MSKSDEYLLKNMINKEKLSQIKSLFDSVDATKEFEVSLYNFPGKKLSMDKYIGLLKYYGKQSKEKANVENSRMLDVIYMKDDVNNYRITIDNSDKIDEYMDQLQIFKNQNHIIFRTLLLKLKEKNSNLTLLKKIKEKEQMIDDEDYNIRARLSEELTVDKTEMEQLQKINYLDMDKIVFRLKDRVSYYIEGDSKSESFIKVDLTTTKLRNHINRINDAVSNYELEVEYGSKTKKNKPEMFDKFLLEIEKIIKIVQQSNFIISNSKEKEILQNYARITGVNLENTTNLVARQPLSLEIQHVTEKLPDKFAVTDKADGDRYFLIILNNNVFLISSNLHVKDTGIKISEKLSKYNDSVLDGEYIFVSSKNRYLYMTFDCLFKGTEDIRKINEFMVRLGHADEIINACFVTDKQNGVKIDAYKNNSDSFELKDVVKFNENQLKTFMKNLNNDLDIDKKYPLIRRKFFIPALGAKNWEIFSYSVMMWDKYSNDPEMNYPYLLDGLVYHPLNQAYVTSVRETTYFEYKWKPPTKNSIDFYISFQKDKQTGKILTVYDNSIDDHVKNKPYKICNLYVGSKGQHGETPALFRENEGGHICHLFLKNNEPVDADGNLITDNTVVEFYYKNDPELDERFQWVPLRTRYDKTESVQRFRRRYGNYIDTANKVWRSIINPLLMSDFEDLAKGNDDKTGNFSYDKKINFLRGKIGHDLILSESKQNVYFQIKTNLASEMRQFHNWVKSILIYTNFHPMYQNNRQLSVLDIACGKGQDILKFYYSKVQFYVGLDIDREALTSAIDGAISRYNKFRRGKPAFPKMDFIQTDVGSLLNYDDQYRALKGMSHENKTAFDKYFSNDPKKRVSFDRVNCQFAIHYFLKNEDTWRNFKDNVKNHLKPGGYFLATTYDARKIVELFGNNLDKYSVDYTDEKGNKKLLFELIKKFGEIKKNDEIKFGNALDFHSSWFMQEGNYITEYLVDKDFLEKEFSQDVDMDLVDTGMFDDLMRMHKEYFMNYAEHEENPETRKFLLNVKKYYDTKNNVNVGCYNNTKLIRYYVFRRRDNLKISKPSMSRQIGKSRKIKKVNQKGGSGVNFDDNTQFMIPKINAPSDTFNSSIFNLLRIHNIIPKSIEKSKFFKDFNIEQKDDDSVNSEYIKCFNNNICVSHENKLNKNIIDGINIIVIEKDCDQLYEYDIHVKKELKDDDKFIILHKDGNNYRPVYRKENLRVRGFYNLTDDLIQEMIS